MPRRDKDKKDAADIAATGTMTIEADSVEEAMQRIATEHGSTAEIVDARKVNRGGIGGFFAKERVQLTVKTPEMADAAPDDSSGLADVLDRMTRSAEAQEAEFATMLRNELGEDTRDLGLDTFLEAVGWDAKKSAAAAEETLQAAGDVAAATTQAPAAAQSTPAEVQTPTPAMSAATNVAPQPAMAQTISGSAAAELAARAATRASMQLAATPQPVVVQHPGLAAPISPTPPTPTPLEEVVDTGAATPEILRQAAREGVITTNPEPTQMAVAAHPVAPDQLKETEMPSWRLTPLDVDPAGMGAVAWSTMELVRCGIPTEIVSAVAELNPTDDLSWITGLAAAVAPYCEALQGVDTVLVGSNAIELAEALEIDVVEPGQTAPYAGSFASAVTTEQDDRDWLQFVRGKRRLHYVMGSDQNWRESMMDAPAVVSWTDEASLIDALYLAVAFDARLGFGVTPNGGRFAKIYPIDVALAIRSMMGRS